MGLLCGLDGASQRKDGAFADADTGIEVEIDR